MNDDEPRPIGFGLVILTAACFWASVFTGVVYFLYQFIQGLAK